MAWVLECLQPYLARRWWDVEIGKGFIGEIEHMQQLGARQAIILDAYWSAVVAHRRLDLARFLLDALQRLVLDGGSAMTSGDMQSNGTGLAPCGSGHAGGCGD